MKSVRISAKAFGRRHGFAPRIKIDGVENLIIEGVDTFPVPYSIFIIHSRAGCRAREGLGCPSHGKTAALGINNSSPPLFPDHPQPLAGQQPPQISSRAHLHSGQYLCSSRKRPSDCSLGPRVAGIKTRQLLVKGSPDHGRVFILNEAESKFSELFLFTQTWG